MALRIAAALSLIVGTHGAAQLQKHLRLEKEPEPPRSFVRALEFKHSLRVCNAYPDTSGVSVRRGADQLTEEEPMPYKACRDFEAPLIAGDKLEFKIGETTTGTFSVSDLPNSDAVLLLVIHRHDADSAAVAFASHVFANTDAAQLAVIDTYKGSQQATPKLSVHVFADASAEHQNKTVAASEELRFDSVVAVDAGAYDVSLDSTDGHEEAKAQLVAVPRGSYVVLRTGVESAAGPAYPEELVVFPSASAAELDGAKAGSSSWSARIHAFVARFWH